MKDRKEKKKKKSRKETKENKSGYESLNREGKAEISLVHSLWVSLYYVQTLTHYFIQF